METLIFNKNCEYCNKPLRARPIKNRYKDFKKRDMHLKCFKQIRINPFLKKCYYNIEDMVNTKEEKTKTDIKDNWKINFGKHKNKTFRELLEFKEYCEWIVEQGEDFNNKKLYDYIKENLTDLV